jgi:hypothetical protein
VGEAQDDAGRHEELVEDEQDGDAEPGAGRQGVGDEQPEAAQ